MAETTLALPERAFLQHLMTARVTTYAAAARTYNNLVDECGGDAVRAELEVGVLAEDGESLERLVARLNRGIQDTNFVVRRGRDEDGTRHVGVCNASAGDLAERLPSSYSASEVALFRAILFDKMLDDDAAYHDVGSMPLMEAYNMCRDVDVGTLRMTEAEAAIKRLVADRWLARVHGAHGEARLSPGIRTYLEVREANAWKMRRAQSAAGGGALAVPASASGDTPSASSARAAE